MIPLLGIPLRVYTGMLTAAVLIVARKEKSTNRRKIKHYIAVKMNILELHIPM